MAPESCVDEKGPQKRATNANGNHVLDGLASCSLPFATAYLLREALDLVQHFPDLRDHVFALHNNFLHSSQMSL